MPELNTPTAAHEVLDNAERQYKALKRQLEKISITFSSTSSGRDVLSLIDFLTSCTAPLQAAVDTPAVAQLAKDKYSDQAYDVIVKLQALITKMESVKTEIVALIPTQGQWILLMALDVNGKAQWRSITPEQLAPVKAKVDEIIVMFS